MIDFVVIGARNCGTGSFYDYLVQHPSTFPATVKNINFFDDHFSNGVEWYRRHFPLLTEHPDTERPKDIQTGETSSSYLFHPLVPERMKRMAPNAKFFVLIRNPTDRAYLHFREMVDEGIERLSFYQAVKVEAKRLERGNYRIRENPFHKDPNTRNHSYISRGIYAQQLRRWYDFFPREQFMIARSEDFFDDPYPIIEKAYEFLGLSPFEPDFVEPPYENPLAMLTEDTRRHIDNFYVKYNEDLFRLTGIKV